MIRIIVPDVNTANIYATNFQSQSNLEAALGTNVTSVASVGTYVMAY